MSHPSVPPLPQNPPPHGTFGPPQQPGTYPGSYPGGGAAAHAYSRPLPAPVPPSGGRGGGRGRLALVIAAVLAALALIGAGTAALLHDGQAGRADSHSQEDGKPATASPASRSTEGKELFRVAGPKTPADDDQRVSAEGTWITSTTYASGAPSAVKGYDAATGKPRWTVPLSGNLCEASRTITSTGRIAVVHIGTKNRCTEFAVIDVNKGLVVWRKSIPNDKANLGLHLSVAISEDIAAAGWPGASVGYQLSTGKQMWDAPTQGCTGEEHSGGRQLLTIGGCDGRFKVGQRSPDTGKTTWRYTLPKKAGAWIVSNEPLVLAVMSGADLLDADGLLTVSTSGKLEATIDIGDDYVAGCEMYGTTCNAIVTTKDTIYTSSDPHSFFKANAIAAFDVHTGKRKWVSTAATDLARTLVPIRAEGDGLIAYMQPTGMRGSRVVHLAPQDGKQTTLLQMPDGLAQPDDSMVADDAGDPALYERGKLYLHHTGAFDKYNADIPMTLALTTK